MSALLANSLSRASNAVRAALKSFLYKILLIRVNSVATVFTGAAAGVADAVAVGVGDAAVGAGVAGSYPALCAAEIGRINEKISRPIKAGSDLLVFIWQG